MQLAITGATGHIGGQVARLLSDQGLPLILPLRNPSRAPRLPDCEPRPFSYSDFELAREALQGVDALFMVSAAESPTREQEHLTLVRAAQAAGIQHLVYLSFAEARPDSTFTLARTHAATEEAIRRHRRGWHAAPGTHLHPHRQPGTEHGGRCPHPHHLHRTASPVSQRDHDRGLCQPQGSLP